MNGPFVFKGDRHMKEYAEQFYSSKAWQHCREGYRKSKQGLCEQCLKAGRIEAGIIVHHKVHISPNNIHIPEVTLNYDNLELLCRQCHSNMHTGKVKRYKVDAVGRIAPLSD